MARSRRTTKFRDPRLAYSCLHCGLELADETPEHHAKIALHRALHVDDREERLRLSHRMIAEQYSGQPARTE